MATYIQPVTRATGNLITASIWNQDAVENIKAIYEGKFGLVDAKGDLLVGSAADLLGRLAVGAEGTSPVSRAAASLGIAWESVGGGAFAEISETVLGSAQASVTFSSIAATYRHLLVVFSASLDAAGSAQMRLQFNVDTGSNYDYVSEDVSSSGLTAAGATAQTQMNIGIVTGTDANRASAGFIFIPDYSRTFDQKLALGFASVVYGTGATEAQFIRRSGRWRNTAAITQVLFNLSTANFATSSFFGLYGLGSS